MTNPEENGDFFPETLAVPLGETTAGNTTYSFQWR